ncbi:TaqI-like C-terminal specificity domain-containing protein [Halogeometricum sp. CBA1124]|uniref:TaqI-like C-terminal specificity domain-containing protein n=1 Tax=Halogeometricum sp. CBA1124 TaxID=2668071 RepID=UPI0018D1F9E7
MKSGIWRRIITSDDIRRWNVSTPKEAAFFPYDTSNGDYELISEEKFESEYGDTYELLVEHQGDLLDRKDSRRTWRQLGRPWYSLFRTGTPDYFEKDKIVTDVVVSDPHFCIDTNGYLFENGFILGITPLETDPYYLTGLLNTDAIFAYLKPISPPKNSGYIELFVDQLEQVPVHLPEIRADLCADIENVLAKHEEKFKQLRQSIQTDGVNEVVDSSEKSELITANLIREISKKIVEEYDSLSSEEIEQLEQLNNVLVGELYDLTEGELRSLSQI